MPGKNQNKLLISISIFHFFGTRLLCTSCGFSRSCPTTETVASISASTLCAAHSYFGAELWLQHPFKNEVFWAYNDKHLSYLEQ